MTTQKAKAYLNQAREAERAYRLARDKANSYAQLIMGGKAVKYGSDGSTHEKNGNNVERIYCCLADYQAEADRLMMEMLGVRQQVEKVIGTVPDAVQREVLTRRYVIGQRWEDIAFVMNYNIRHIYKIHGAALQSMALNGTITL